MSRGWERDALGWWRRPVYRRDARLVLGNMAAAYDLLPVSTVRQMCEANWSIGTGHHAFFDRGWLYCRNARQKRRLDNGLTV